MEKNKLATLVATSMLSAMSANASTIQGQVNDSGIHETVSLFRDMHTCGQCNGPNIPVASCSVDDDDRPSQ